MFARFFDFITAICAVVIVASSFAYADDHKIKNPNISVVLDPSLSEQIAKFIEDQETKVTAQFMISAVITSSSIVCQMTREGVLACHKQDMKVCPERIAMHTGREIFEMEVDCSGPDANGECDCDFANPG